MLRTFLWTQILDRLQQTAFCAATTPSMPFPSQSVRSIDDLAMEQSSGLGREFQLVSQRTHWKECANLEKMLESSGPHPDYSQRHSNNCPTQTSGTVSRHVLFVYGSKLWHGIHKPSDILKTSATLPHLLLSKFAFQASPTSIAFPSASAAVPQRDVISEEKFSRSTIVRNRKRTSLSVLKVSESAMSLLERCVCCEARWTTKRTVAQKLDHIEACAKKRVYATETVSILLRKELSLDGDATMDASTTNTHLEDIVQESHPRKKVKSKNGSTVQEFSSETRVSARKRLRSILGPPIAPRGHDEAADAFLPSTQFLLPTLPASAVGVTGMRLLSPSPTMPFLPSKLLQAQSGQTPFISPQCSAFRVSPGPRYTT
jgi:hypothetical protein